MGCPCKDKKNAPETKSASPVQTNGENRMAPTFKLEFTVRSEGHPLACELCLAKHIGTAYVLSSEVLEDTSRKTEKLLCISNLKCAADHAQALGKTDLVDTLNAAVMDFHFTLNTAKIINAVEEICGGDARSRMKIAAAGQMSAAEQMLRMVGRGDVAEKIRSIRLDFAGDKEGSEK